MHFKSQALILTSALLFSAGCATTGNSSSHPLPGRHAYSIQTLEGQNWVEFDCEKYEHQNPKIGWGTRVRKFYSDQKTFALTLEGAEGFRQIIRLPGCESVRLDGQFPERLFRSFRSQDDQSCASPDARGFLGSDNRSYRCWGSIGEIGYVVEYFYVHE